MPNYHAQKLHQNNFYDLKLRDWGTGLTAASKKYKNHIYPFSFWNTFFKNLFLYQKCKKIKNINNFVFVKNLIRYYIFDFSFA